LFRDHSTRARSKSAALAVAAACLLAACTDRPNPLAPDGKPGSPAAPGTPVTIAQVECTGSVPAKTVTCAAPKPVGPDGDIVVGGQNVYVKLTSSNAAYNSGTGQFTFDVTVQNLIQQPMGTTDGMTLDPNGVRIFFNSGPSMTGGTGSVSVLPDGFATFLAPGQAYYQYSQVLAQNQTSAAKTWTLIMPPTVSTFAFTVYVSAPVEYPNGYVSMDGQLPGYSYGLLHPGASHTFTAVAKTAVGNPVPGAVVTFSSSDPACAAIGPSNGTMTGVRAGTCTMTATATGGLTGSIVCNVTGTVRTWNGSASTDWNTDANWDAPAAGVAAFAPAAADSVLIPGGMPRYPLLTGATAIGGVTVATGGSIDLAAFDLTASQNVAVSSGGSIGGASGHLVLSGSGATAAGAVGRTTVTGTYTASGNVTATGPLLVRGGLLKSVGNNVFVQ
jgi:hypothetical protein